MMKSEIRDGMKIDWDAPIEMDDGVVLRGDVFRPLADGKYPVILSYGPYAKGLAMQEGYKSQWLRIIKAAPDVLEGSSNKHQNWELFDPEKWVPLDYVLVRVDSRGAGRSPGHLEVWSPREAKDIALCVDWAGVQPWSNGKVGIHGISYYSTNQWHAGPLRPKHLAALCIWEGCFGLLPRALPPRRHPVGLLCELVSAPGHRRAARCRRPRRKERGHRRAGRRPGHAVAPSS